MGGGPPAAGAKILAIFSVNHCILALKVMPHTLYIVRRFTTGSPIDGAHWLPNKEMTKLWEVSDDTSTDRFPHFQCLTLQCDTSTLSLRSGG